MTEHQKALAMATIKAEANGLLAELGVARANRSFLLDGLTDLKTVRSMAAGLERVDMQAILSELRASDRGQLAWAEVQEEEPADAIGVDINDVSYRGRMARMTYGRRKK